MKCCKTLALATVSRIRLWASRADIPSSGSPSAALERHWRTVGAAPEARLPRGEDADRGDRLSRRPARGAARAVRAVSDQALGEICDPADLGDAQPKVEILSQAKAIAIAAGRLNTEERIITLE